MRVTVQIDDDLFNQAVELADRNMTKSELIQEAVNLFIRVQAGKRLAALGGDAEAEQAG